MSIRNISWACYIVGIAIILGSYLNLVSPSVGWIGWIIGMAGWGMQFLPGVRRSTVADELASLAQLHAAGQITDEEYEAAKQRAIR